jgi:hypothetical protein
MTAKQALNTEAPLAIISPSFIAQRASPLMGALRELAPMEFNPVKAFHILVLYTI